MRIKLLLISGIVLCLCPMVYAEGPLHTEEELSLFSGGWADAIWTVITFVVLLVALRKLVWKKMLEGLNARADYIQNQVTDAEKKKSEAESVLAQYQDKLAGVGEEGKKIIEAHTKKARQESKEITAKARKDIEIIRQKAELEIETAKKRAHEDLLDSSSRVVLELGAEILARNITSKDNQRLIDQAVQRLKTELIAEDAENKTES